MNHIMKPNLTIILLIISATLFSCKNKPTTETEAESGFIEITKAQFKSELMEFGEPTISPFVEKIHFTGSIVPSVNGRAHISLPIQGVVDRINYIPGQYVNKGAVLFQISGNQFIDMQKDFAESAALLQRLKGDFERQKELRAENIGTQKEYIFAESLYNVEKAKLGALRIKLENLGLNISQIEEGAFYNSFSLKAPIKGFVSDITVTIGQYVEPQQIIASIIDDSSFQIQLSVFEKDINAIKVGQDVEFYLTGNKSVMNTGRVKIVSKAIDNSTKSIDCFAEIENPGKISLVNNQFVEGDVIVSSDSVLSVPEGAILKSASETYVLAFKNETDELYYFSKLKVTTGRKNNGFVELKEVPESKKLLIKGVYNILIE